MDEAIGIVDLAVVILMKDEALHIRRCMERLRPIGPRQVFVIDCFSTDGSDKAAAAMGATVVQHAWPGLHSKQFNWAIDNLPITTEWILRLDADEYLTPETAERLKNALSGDELDGVNGLTFELKRRFMGGEIRHGTDGIRLLRMWRRGQGRIEDRAMDEHVRVSGRVVDFDGAFYDDSLNAFSWWLDKHRGYAKREAIDAMSYFGSLSSSLSPTPLDRRKAIYYKAPPYLRAVLYFLYRYFIRLGFLDGIVGWRWHFWQGLWYRWCVDREISKLKRSRG